MREVVDEGYISENDAKVEVPDGAKTITFTAGAASTEFEGIEVTFTWTVDQQATSVDLNLLTDLT